MMHHGVVEHYRGQSRYFEEYLVKKDRKVARLLAKHQVGTVFTGHYHANDITIRQWEDGSWIFDVETGSLVTYPCPIRRVVIRDDSLHIRTDYIRSIPSMREGFPEFARNYVRDGVAGVAEKTMIGMNIHPPDARRLSSQIGDAFLAHYAGDEVPKKPPVELDSVKFKSRMIISFKKKLIKGLYQDLPPSDNQLSIHLGSGAYAE
jgi:hypothetical protein